MSSGQSTALQHEATDGTYSLGRVHLIPDSVLLYRTLGQDGALPRGF